MRSALPVLVLTALAATAAAQVPQAIPYTRTLDLLVVDSTNDCVWRMSDFNQDGDYQDAGEIVSFYSDTIGSIALSNPTCIVAAPDGTVYVGDSTADIVLALRDQNGDGDANDPGEHRVFFDSATNAGGITMASVMGITVDAIGRLFLAVANAGTTGTDLILLLHDVDNDGDANDLGEAISYCTIPGGAGAGGNSVPTKVVVGPGGSVFYTDIASSGPLAKGVYKLTDVNQNGHCNDPGEVSLFWTFPGLVPSPNYFGLAVSQSGTFYLSDSSNNEQVWAARDVDANGVVDPGEQRLFFQSTGSTWWDVVLRDDGDVLVCDATAPDHVTALRDLNLDGDANDAGESNDAYNAAGASVAVSLRGACMLQAPTLVLAPPVVSIGGATTVVTLATKPGDLTLLVMSIGLGPAIPLPPWGVVRIDTSVFVSLSLGFADANALHSVPFAVPNLPAALGTWAFQSLSGDAYRLFLSNPGLLTVL
jgi:hypothetical protein